MLIVTIITLLLSSCSSGGPHMFSRLFDNDKDVANAKMDKVLEAIKNKDKDSLKSMFSKKAIAEAENFDQSIADLFDFFQGDFVSYNDWTGPMVEEGRNDDGTGRNWKSTESTYDVDTSEQKYRFAIKGFTKDTADPDNIGICSLYIIKKEDTNEKFAYWGDNKWTPGINFNKKNVIPDEES